MEKKNFLHALFFSPPTRKLAERSLSPRLFRLSPSSRSRHRLCCRTATFTHFWSSTIYTTFHSTHFISQRGNAIALELLDHSVKIRSQVQTITCAILPQNQSPSASSSQRGRSCEQIFDSSTTFLNSLVGRNSLCRKRTVSRFFCLASHVLRACEARALRARKRYALPISLLILRKKNDSFAVLDEIGGSAINRNSWSVQCKIDIQSRIKFQYIWRKLWTFRTSIKITLSIIWEAFPTYV